MRRLHLLLFSVVMFGLVATSQASIYNIANYPADQDGWTMTGTITTTDVGTAATVDSVAVTLTNGTTSYLLNKYSGTSSLKIVGLELTIPLDVISEIEASASPNAFVLFDNDADQYTGAVPGAPFFLWNLTPPLDPSVPGDRIGLSPMIFGTLQQTTLQTPEPASLTVWALLGLVGVFYLRRRSAKA